MSFALELAYGRAAVRSVTGNPWRRPMVVSWNEAEPNWLTVSGEAVSLEHAFFFTPHRDGASLRHPIVLRRGDRGETVLEPAIGRALVERGTPAVPLDIEPSAR